jgi:hypothetical protein
MANTSIQLKKSSITGNVPASLAYGELAINYADGKLFYKHANGSIASISTGSLTNSFATVNANSSLILATSPTDTLSILPGNNITISTDTVGKSITINSTATGGSGTTDQFARNTANAAFNQANAAIDLAQSAYNYANTIPGGGGGSLTVSNDITSNTARFINFTSNTSGAISTINTSSNNLTYVPETGTLKTLALNVTANTNISANSATVVGTSQQVLDSFSTELYRGAFYQIQMETSGGFQVLNISIVNSESSAQVTTFGDAYNASVLATFDASVSGGLVQLKITPTQSSTTVSYLRHALVKLTAGIPSGDLGFVADPTTASFDAGFDLDATTTTYDYGFVS